MSANLLIGRHSEQNQLKQLFQSRKAEFLALYGRRRVGKTYLIKNFFEKERCVFFYSTGLRQGSFSEQLAMFTQQIGETFYGGASISVRENWRETFDELTKAVNQIPRGKKIVLFFDELPWMVTPRSGLLDALDYYWNRHWSHDSRLKLIVCGSSASWIIDNLINNEGGLYNRVTRTMNLEPFTLNETQAFLKSLGVHLNQKQVLELYLVLGGIPHYLALVRKGLSAHQCIDELCFQKGGALVQEFDRLFASLFRNPDVYMTLIKTIAKHRYGIGQAELIQASGVAAGGRTVKRLKELEDSGFILEFVPYGHQEKGLYYRVIDEFTLFYLRWVKPNMSSIRKQGQASGYWLSKVKSPHWQAWSGYAFEAVCYKHLAMIRKALGIEAGAETGSWRYAPRGDKQGTQIDLLFDRDDGVTTLCEIKYNQKPFVIDKRYAKTLTSKLEIYRKQTRTTKQLFLAMVTANGLNQNQYADELISGVVTLTDLFQDVA